MRVDMPEPILTAILERAAATPEVEICGLLFGCANRIEESRATANVAADPARTFEIDPAALLTAHRAHRIGGPRLIGHYHSHPSGSAEPSATDIAAAEPGKLWLIVGAGRARLWRAGHGSFAEVHMAIMR